MQILMSALLPMCAFKMHNAQTLWDLMCVNVLLVTRVMVTVIVQVFGSVKYVRLVDPLHPWLACFAESNKAKLEI